MMPTNGVVEASEVIAVMEINWVSVEQWRIRLSYSTVRLPFSGTTAHLPDADEAISVACSIAWDGRLHGMGVESEASG